MHAIKILNEAIWHLQWEAFEGWVEERDSSQWKQSTEKVLKAIHDNDTEDTKQFHLIKEAQPQLMALQQEMAEFQKSYENCPTAIFWLQFLSMSDILLM